MPVLICKDNFVQTFILSPDLSIPSLSEKRTTLHHVSSYEKQQYGPLVLRSVFPSDFKGIGICECISLWSMYSESKNVIHGTYGDCGKETIYFLQVFTLAPAFQIIELSWEEPN